MSMFVRRCGYDEGTCVVVQGGLRGLGRGVRKASYASDSVELKGQRRARREKWGCERASDKTEEGDAAGRHYTISLKSSSSSSSSAPALSSLLLATPIIHYNTSGINKIITSVLDANNQKQLRYR